MSPEQASGAREYDGRSDLYSLACVLYEAVAGTPAFVGANPQAILAQRLVHVPRPVSVYRPAVPTATRGSPGPGAGHRSRRPVSERGRIPRRARCCVREPGGRVCSAPRRSGGRAGSPLVGSSRSRLRPPADAQSIRGDSEPTSSTRHGSHCCRPTHRVVRQISSTTDCDAGRVSRLSTSLRQPTRSVLQRDAHHSRCATGRGTPARWTVCHVPRGHRIGPPDGVRCAVRHTRRRTVSWTTPAGITRGGPAKLCHPADSLLLLAAASTGGRLMIRRSAISRQHSSCWPDCKR